MQSHQHLNKTKFIEILSKNLQNTLSGPVWQIIWYYQLDTERLEKFLLALQSLTVIDHGWYVILDYQEDLAKQAKGNFSAHLEFLSQLSKAFLSAADGQWDLTSTAALDLIKIMSDYKHLSREINFGEHCWEIIWRAKHRKDKSIDLIDLIQKFEDFPIVIKKPDEFLNQEQKKSDESVVVRHGWFACFEFVKIASLITFAAHKGSWSLIKEVAKIPFIIYVDVGYFYKKFSRTLTHLFNNEQWRSALGIAKKQSYKERFIRYAFLASILSIEYFQLQHDPAIKSSYEEIPNVDARPFFKACSVFKSVIVERVLFEYLPAMAELDVISQRARSSLKTWLFVATSLLSGGLLQYYKLDERQSELSWIEAAPLLLAPLVTVPRLLLGAERSVPFSTDRKPLKNRNKDALGYDNSDSKVNSVFLLFAFAIMSILDGNPVLIVPSILFYLASALSLLDREPTWTPRQFKLPAEAKPLSLAAPNISHKELKSFR